MSQPMGWYNPRGMVQAVARPVMYGGATMAPPIYADRVRLRRKVFDLKSFRIPSIIFCLIGAAMIALGITNLVFTSRAYYTDPTTGQATTSWYGCNPNATSIVSPNNSIRGGVFWLFVCMGLIIGIWCFLTGIWAYFSPALSKTWLRALKIVLMITFVGCLVLAIFAVLDIVASYSCLDVSNMDLNANVKVLMPFLLVILAAIQLIVTGVLYNLVAKLLKFKKSQHYRARALPNSGDRLPRRRRYVDTSEDEDNPPGGFRNWMGFSSRAPYANFRGF